MHVRHRRIAARTKAVLEILFARNSKAGVTELVRVMRNEVLRNEAMRNGVIQDERIQGQSTKAGLRALPSIPGRPL